MKRVTMTVDPADYAVLEQMAKDGDVSASWLIRRSMREFIERHGTSGTVEITLGIASGAQIKS